MNAKNVLNKIMALLSMDDTQLAAITAETKDGTILQSSNFDVNDDVVVVSEDGTTSPAPDGQYEITFTTPEGEKSIQIIEIAKGKIDAIETPSEVGAEANGTDAKETEMASDMVPAHALPNTTDEDPRNSLGTDSDETDSPIISELKARISELELELEGYKMAEELPTEELPKLDGAPIEENMKKFSAVKAYGSKNKVGDSQNTFLSKLYK